MSQSLRLRDRLDAWHKAIVEYFSGDWEERLFEVFDDGRLLPWKVISAS